MQYHASRVLMAKLSEALTISSLVFASNARSIKWINNFDLGSCSYRNNFNASWNYESFVLPARFNF